MEALSKISKVQNICIICTLHQPTNEVLLMTDYLYVLTKGGHNCYSGPTLQLSEFLGEFKCDFSDFMIPIDGLLKITTDLNGNEIISGMKAKINEEMKGIIGMSNELINSSIDNNINTNISLKDIIILLRRELDIFLQFEYR